MITVLISAILATMAMAAYTDSIQRAKRSQAQRAVLGFAQVLERNFTNTNTYATQQCLPLVCSIYPAAVPPDGNRQLR